MPEVAAVTGGGPHSTGGTVDPFSAGSGVYHPVGIAPVHTANRQSSLFRQQLLAIQCIPHDFRLTTASSPANSACTKS